MSLLTDEQKPIYEKIQKDRHERMEALRGEMVKTMKDTNLSIRALLTPEQQNKFDEIARQSGPPHPSSGRIGGSPPMMGGPHFHHHGGTDPTQPPRAQGDVAGRGPESGAELADQVYAVALTVW